MIENDALPWFLAGCDWCDGMFMGPGAERDLDEHLRATHPRRFARTYESTTKGTS